MTYSKFDLLVFAGALAASKQLETHQLQKIVLVGELAFTGANPSIGNLPPYHSQSQIDGFPAFPAFAALPSLTIELSQPSLAAQVPGPIPTRNTFYVHT